VKDRIFAVADLMMGAAYADAKLEGAEKATIRRLLREILVVPTLPMDLDVHIDSWKTEGFDVGRVAAAFTDDPPAMKRKLLDLLSAVHAADEEFDLAEDAYLRQVGVAIGLPEERFRDLVATVIDERNLSQEMEAVRLSRSMPVVPDGET
jgi:uncharacterized tellurite resistance protein B-like protein